MTRVVGSGSGCATSWAKGFSGTVWTLALTLTLAPPPASAGRPRHPATAPARRTAARREPRLAFQRRSAGRRTSGSIYPAVNADPTEGTVDSRGDVLRGHRFAAPRRGAAACRTLGRLDQVAQELTRV